MSSKTRYHTMGDATPTITAPAGKYSQWTPAANIMPKNISMKISAEPMSPVMMTSPVGMAACSASKRTLCGAESDCRTRLRCHENEMMNPIFKISEGWKNSVDVIRSHERALCRASGATPSGVNSRNISPSEPRMTSGSSL